MLGELEIDIGFTGTGNAVKKLGVSFNGLKFGEGLFLSGVKGDFGGSGVGGDVSVGSGGSGGGGDSGNSGGSGGVGVGGSVGRGRSGKFFAAIFLNAEREKKVGSFGDWI